MVKSHKIVQLIVVACLITNNLGARTGHAITWAYKGHYHEETADHVRVFTPTDDSERILIPVQDPRSLKNTGQNVVVQIVNAYCVPPYRRLADSNLFFIFLGSALTAAAWMIDRVRIKRHISRAG
jgi:hypothetical protein